MKNNNLENNNLENDNLENDNLENDNLENNNSLENNNLENDLENNNSLSKIQKLIKYFSNIHILSINYLSEILNNLDNKETKDKLEIIVKNNKFNIYNKQLNKSNKVENYIIFNNINLAKV